MKPKLRYAWIEDYLKEFRFADVLNTDFVIEYIEATNAKAAFHFYGAPTCRQLGRDLSAIYKQGRLKRSRRSLHAMESGFPKWVWAYELP